MRERNRYRQDALGTRMKSYEALTTKTTLMPNTPVYARIDGRAFHTFTRGLQKPIDAVFNTLMMATCCKLVAETNAILGYVQSDEISLGWEDISKAPFEGKLFKLESVLASMATAIFYIALANVHESLMKNPKLDEEDRKSMDLIVEKAFSAPVQFDCRIFNVPNMDELANAFLWRENDATKNSISSLAQAHFSHKALQGKNQNEMQNMLLEQKDINWNDMPDIYKRGAYMQRVVVAETIPDEIWNKIPEGAKPADRIYSRSYVDHLELPCMRKVKNKVGVYFYKEEPKFE